MAKSRCLGSKFLISLNANQRVLTALHQELFVAHSASSPSPAPRSTTYLTMMKPEPQLASLAPSRGASRTVRLDYPSSSAQNICSWQDEPTCTSKVNLCPISFVLRMSECCNKYCAPSISFRHMKVLIMLRFRL